MALVRDSNGRNPLDIAEDVGSPKPVMDLVLDKCPWTARPWSPTGELLVPGTLSNSPCTTPDTDRGHVTQHGWSPEFWGLTLTQIQLLMKHPLLAKYKKREAEKGIKIKYPSMRRVVQEIIIPATKDTGMGYSLLVNKECPLRVKMFVSVSDCR